MASDVDSTQPVARLVLSMACLALALAWPQWRTLVAAEGDYKAQYAFLYCNTDVTDGLLGRAKLLPYGDCAKVEKAIKNGWSFETEGSQVEVYNDRPGQPFQVLRQPILARFTKLRTEINAVCARVPAHEVNVFIYFAGHGSVQSGSGYFVLSDLGKFTRRDLTDIVNQSSRPSCVKHVVIAVDADFSERMNPLVGSTDLAKLVFGFSTSTNWLSIGHARESHSNNAWTEMVFLKGLDERHADQPPVGNNDRILTVEEAFKYGFQAEQPDMILLRMAGITHQDAIPLFRDRDGVDPGIRDGDPANDTVLDPLFPDLDGDGVPDSDDNCVATSNDSQADADGDGRGDACDLDNDADGWLDAADNCPATMQIEGLRMQRDLDGDGLGDVCDPDADGDGAANPADPDDDNDSVPDAGDNCALVPNPSQGDADGDGAGDVCEIDADGDGVQSDLEVEFGSNPTQQASLPEFARLGVTYTDGRDNDQDGMADGLDPDCHDQDDDAVPDLLDNCPSVPNHQWDADRDGIGDECDIEGVNQFVTFQSLPGTQRTTSATTGCPAGFVGTFSFVGRLVSRVANPPLWTLQARVRTLTNGNVLQNADDGPGGVGALRTIPLQDGFADGVLRLPDFVDVPFTICLKRRTSFTSPWMFWARR